MCSWRWPEGCSKQRGNGNCKLQKPPRGCTACGWGPGWTLRRLGRGMPAPTAKKLNRHDIRAEVSQAALERSQTAEHLRLEEEGTVALAKLAAFGGGPSDGGWQRTALAALPALVERLTAGVSHLNSASSDPTGPEASTVTELATVLARVASSAPSCREAIRHTTAVTALVSLVRVAPRALGAAPTRSRLGRVPLCAAAAGADVMALDSRECVCPALRLPRVRGRRRRAAVPHVSPVWRRWRSLVGGANLGSVSSACRGRAPREAAEPALPPPPRRRRPPPRRPKGV